MPLTPVFVVPMNRSWDILCWNVRVINNSANEWPLIRNNMDESNCDIFCFQETKKDKFDSAFIRNFAPRKFDMFLFAPSMGASGGILVWWNGSNFDGTINAIQPFVISMNFSSRADLHIWNLVIVYEPCVDPAC